MTHADRARAYYRAIDGDDYETLEGLLAPAFVHERPDRTLTGRDRFVQFMREERPQSDTTHPVDAVYRPVDDRQELVVRGTVRDASGEALVRFVDVFQFDGDRVERLRTYTR